MVRRSLGHPSSLSAQPTLVTRFCLLPFLKSGIKQLSANGQPPASS